VSKLFLFRLVTKHALLMN